MEDIIENSLLSAKSYNEYKELVLQLLREGKSTGPVQSEDRFQFTRLNTQRMKRLDKQTRLSNEAVSRAEQVQKDFTWLVLTESWCGDAAQTLPVINKFAEINERIELKVVLRDENEDLMNRFLTDGNKAIPKLIVIDKATKKVINSWGPRTAKAAKMVQEYKEKHGKIDARFKEELQHWYNADKGAHIERELLDLLNDMILS